MSALQTVDILRAAQGGDGVGHLEDGCVVFVRGALIGERVDVLVTQRKKNFARADLVSIRSASPHRVEPACAYAGTCGGCDFWHTTYAHEFEIKTSAAMDTLRRVGRLELPDVTLHPAKSVAGWRTRATLTTDRRTRSIGFVGRGSRAVVDFQTCKVLDPTIEAAILELRERADACQGRIFVETDGRGGVIVDAAGGAADWLSDTIHGVADVAGEQTVLSSQSHATLLDAEVPAGRFRQGNTAMNAQLVETAVGFLANASHVVELYCGMGNFTMAYAARCEAVLACDVDVRAVETLGELAAPLRQVTTAVCDLDQEMPEFSTADAVLLDPPRTGAAFAVAALAAQPVPLVVYVSCDVPTLARDARTLVDAGYTLTELAFVDMFPRTSHIETVAVLRHPRLS